MTIEQLKPLLRQKNLPTSGRKADLIARLTNLDNRKSPQYYYTLKDINSRIKN